MKKRQIGLARDLRKKNTDAERYIWRHLRSKQLEGLKFRRQHPIGKYVVDFVCLEKKIIVEVDGGQHSQEVDGTRDKWLANEGFEVLRFWNNEVLKNIDGVLEVIRLELLSHPHPSPLPSREREKLEALSSREKE